MAVVTRQQQAAEAVCSLLYNNDFEAIGETDNGRVSWFTRGEKPRRIRVNVNRAATFDGIVVTCEGANIATRQIVRITETFTIPTSSSEAMNGIHEAVVACGVWVLEFFKDVLAGEGRASAKAIEHLKFDDA